MADISVIIPVYKVEEYIRKCVDSVINQTLKDIEIILVDDGSPDNCPVICDEYEKTDSRIKVIHKKNGGLSDARNTGMRAAEGEYILFVDSDDWVEDNTCEILLDEVKKDNAEFVITAYYIETANGTSVKHIFNDSKIVFTDENIKEKLFRRILCLTKEELRHPEQIDSLSSVCSKLYKRAVVSENGIEFIDRKKIFSEAIDFNFRYTNMVNTAVYLDIPLYHYLRTNTTSGTTTYRKDFFKQWKNWIEYVKQFIEKNGYHDLLDEALYNRICFAVISCGGYASRADSFKQAYIETNTLLKDPILIEAFKHLNFAYFPLKWKLFFGLAKYRLAFGFLMLTKIMRYSINKKRNLS